MDDETSWSSEWLRGVLSLCVLAVIAQGETYGYAIGQRLQAAGLGKVKGGTIYPLLNRLEQDGLVSSSWVAGSNGPGRKTFRATPHGLAHLAERQEAWQIFASRVSGLLVTKGAVS